MYHYVSFSHSQVKKSRGKGGFAGPDGIKSVFGQMAQKMGVFGPDSLMLPHRIWKVKFVGELSFHLVCSALVLSFQIDCP